MIYSTVNHQKLPFYDPTHPPLWWRNTWMFPKPTEASKSKKNDSKFSQFKISLDTPVFSDEFKPSCLKPYLALFWLMAFFSQLKNWPNWSASARRGKFLVQIFQMLESMEKCQAKAAENKTRRKEHRVRVKEQTEQCQQLHLRLQVQYTVRAPL